MTKLDELKSAIRKILEDRANLQIVVNTGEVVFAEKVGISRIGSSGGELSVRIIEDGIKVSFEDCKIASLFCTVKSELYELSNEQLASRILNTINTP